MIIQDTFNVNFTSIYYIHIITPIIEEINKKKSANLNFGTLIIYISSNNAAAG